MRQRRLPTVVIDGSDGDTVWIQPSETWLNLGFLTTTIRVWRCPWQPNSRQGNPSASEAELRSERHAQVVVRAPAQKKDVVAGFNANSHPMGEGFNASTGINGESRCPAGQPDAVCKASRRVRVRYVEVIKAYLARHEYLKPSNPA